MSLEPDTRCGSGSASWQNKPHFERSPFDRRHVTSKLFRDHQRTFLLVHECDQDRDLFFGPISRLWGFHCQSSLRGSKTEIICECDSGAMKAHMKLPKVNGECAQSRLKSGGMAARYHSGYLVSRRRGALSHAEALATANAFTRNWSTSQT